MTALRTFLDQRTMVRMTQGEICTRLEKVKGSLISSKISTLFCREIFSRLMGNEVSLSRMQYQKKHQLFHGAKSRKI